MPIKSVDPMDQTVLPELFGQRAMNGTATLKGTECVGCASTSSIRIHYGAPSCHGCKAFFRRSVFEGREYTCSVRNDCDTTYEARNRCRACRLRKCVEGGMNVRLVREERVKSHHNPLTKSPTSEKEDKEIYEQKPIMETALTQFLVGLDKQAESLTDDSVIGDDQLCAWSTSISLTMGLQNPNLVIKRSPMDWRCERVMQPTDLFSQWYRAFVLLADWAMGIPDFCVLPLSDQTHLFKQNFSAFGWLTYTYKCYERGYVGLGMPLGNGSYIPYTEEEQSLMAPRWISTYGLVCKLLIDLIVKPMVQMQMSYEECCLLKTICLFQQEGPLTPSAPHIDSVRERLLQALATHIEIRFPHLTSSERSIRATKLVLLLPSFYQIGRMEAAMIQNLSPVELDELRGVPLEILNNHRRGNCL